MVVGGVKLLFAFYVNHLCGVGEGGEVGGGGDGWGGGNWWGGGEGRK